MENLNSCIVKLSDICRVCLMHINDMKYLLNQDEESNILITMLESLLHFELQLNDILPTYICTSCQKKLNLAYEFQQLCLKSNETIKEIILTNTVNENVKISQFTDDGNLVTEDRNKLNLALEAHVKSGILILGHNFEAEPEKLCNESYRIIEFVQNNSGNANCEKNSLERQICQEEILNIEVTNLPSSNNVQESSKVKIDNVENIKVKEITQLGDNVTKESIEECEGVHVNTFPATEINKLGNCDKSSQLCSKTCFSLNETDENGEEMSSKTFSLQCEENVGKDIAKNYLLNDKKKSDKKLKNVNRKKQSGPNTNKFRLEQFPIEKVNKAIDRLNQKFLEHTKCYKCSFFGSNARALALHITFVHKNIKDRWCSQCNLECDDLNAHQKQHRSVQMVCEFCSKVFLAKGHLVEHLRSHSGLRPFPCSVCGKSFISSRHLRVHSRIHNIASVGYSCPLKTCKKKFAQQASLKKHIKQHKVVCSSKECSFYSDQQDSEGVCCPFHTDFNKDRKADAVNEFCNARIDNKLDTSSYMFNEDGSDNVNERLCDKSDGDKGFSSSSDLLELQNYCKDCNRKVRSLEAHKRRFHNGSLTEIPKKKHNPCLCTVCGKEFKSLSHLRFHSRIHTGETPYQCSFCDKKLLSRNHLKVHERTHTGEKPYVCKLCGKGFAQSTVLATHMRLHTGRPVECNLCNKRFCRKGELKLHMRRHTGEKPYLCTECGKSFIQKGHLIDHQRTHTDDRPYKCQYCNKGFKQNSTLKAHLNIHLGNKPFKCPECSYACRQSYSLTQHMWVHGVETGKPKKCHICFICDKKFSTASRLNTHHVTFHNMVV